MFSVSVRLFRLVCVVALISLLFTQLPRLGLISFSEGVTNAQGWRYFEATAPNWAVSLYAVVYWVLLLIGLVGMLNFWRFARWCLLVGQCGAVLVRPFLGLSVYSAYEAVLGSLCGYLSAWLITISFWSPMADRFTGSIGALRAAGRVSPSRLVLVLSLVLLSLGLLAVAYESGQRMHHRDDSRVYYTQAMLAFGHYKNYGTIAAELEWKCYNDALTNAKEMKKLQIVLLSENLRKTGNDPSLLDYIKLRDADLLKSVLAGHVPELEPYGTNCAPEAQAYCAARGGCKR